MVDNLQRAYLLFEQGRADLAEKEVRATLAQDPTSSRGHALLALCLLHRKEYREALFESAEATRLDPGNAQNHYVEGMVLMETERLEQAMDSASLAISMNPFHPAYHALMSMIHLKKRNWPAALGAADQGLSIDPEHVDCKNYRAMALVKLGRRNEAAISLGENLAAAPEDSFSHANQGWALLHQNRPKDAMIHFREALRLQPDLEFARAGIVEALKAHNFIYRWMLAYFLFMSRLSGRAQWMIILGGWFGMQALQKVSQESPGLRPLVMPLIVAYVIFAILTWLSYPLFNLLLRISRFGRHALSREQTVASNWVGGTLLLCVLSALVMLFTGWQIFVDIAIIFGLMAIPVSGYFIPERGWPRWVMLGACI